jgi:hypothetical protein
MIGGDDFSCLKPALLIKQRPHIRVFLSSFNFKEGAHEAKDACNQVSCETLVSVGLIEPAVFWYEWAGIFDTRYLRGIFPEAMRLIPNLELFKSL